MSTARDKIYATIKNLLIEQLATVAKIDFRKEHLLYFGSLKYSILKLYSILKVSIILKYDKKYLLNIEQNYNILGPIAKFKKPFNSM